MTGYYPPWVPCNPTKCAYGKCNHERHYVKETNKMRRWCEFHSNLYDQTQSAVISSNNVIQVNF